MSCAHTFDTCFGRPGASRRRLVHSASDGWNGPFQASSLHNSRKFRSDFRSQGAKTFSDGLLLAGGARAQTSHASCRRKEFLAPVVHKRSRTGPTTQKARDQRWNRDYKKPPPPLSKNVQNIGDSDRAALAVRVNDTNTPGKEPRLWSQRKGMRSTPSKISSRIGPR